jgi:hypothetical protein
MQDNKDMPLNTAKQSGKGLSEIKKNRAGQGLNTLAVFAGFAILTNIATGTTVPIVDCYLRANV